jgi:hypothetical protein
MAGVALSPREEARATDLENSGKTVLMVSLCKVAEIGIEAPSSGEEV